MLFKPLDASNVKVYLCGPTVYDLAHLGNARNAVVFDVLVRMLRFCYPNVTYVRNITDIDDKIINKAIETGVDIDTITSKTIIQYHEDMASLFVMPPNIEPRATEHIPEMIMIVEKLIQKGHAYISDGHVLFSVKSDKSRGILANIIPQDSIARIEKADYKIDQEDFVLFKPTHSGLPGWDSPWGKVLPGWHLECSAMTWKHLGTDFDIHGGGVDLIFPHHENEISQSCCAFPGSNYANYWIHNQMVLVDGKKMSKSLGNFKTVRDLLEIVPGEALRFFLLKTHYRSEVDFTIDGLLTAKKELDGFYRRLSDDMFAIDIRDQSKYSNFMELLRNDLNIPGAISDLHHLQNPNVLWTMGKLLGLFNYTPEEWFRGDVEVEILQLIEERNMARAAKDFKKSDEIRKSLFDRGIILEDLPTKTVWRKK